MTISPRTNTTLESIASVLGARDNFCLCGHVSPDGDCIGSQLALAAALRELGKHAVCLLARDEPLDGSLLELPGAPEMVFAGAYDGPCDTFIAVDVPRLDRMGAGAAVRERANLTVTIDHHDAPERISDLAYIDPDAASTTLLVWDLALYLGSNRQGTVATCAYAGLMTDTGGFRYDNTDGDAFAKAAAMVEAGANPAALAALFYQNRTLASVKLEARLIDALEMLDEGRVALSWLSAAAMEECHAVRADAEPMIDLLRSLGSASVACVLREQDGAVRGSLRSKHGIDVAAIAREFGGGGHPAAAGFTLPGPLDEAVERVRARLMAIPWEEA